MIVLHGGPSLLLTSHADGKLVLDLRRKATLTREDVEPLERVGLRYAGDNSWVGHARDQAEIVAAVRELDGPRMQVLHDGVQLLFKQDADGTLILDRKLDSQLTEAQIRKIDRLMHPADEDCWFGDASKRHQVEALVRAIDSPRVARDPEEPWTSRAEWKLTEQQRVGGR